MNNPTIISQCLQVRGHEQTRQAGHWQYPECVPNSKAAGKEAVIMGSPAATNLCSLLNAHEKPLNKGACSVAEERNVLLKKQDPSFRLLRGLEQRGKCSF